MSKITWRIRTVGRLRRYLLEKQSPRYHMTCILAVTGLVGFIASATMLHLGLTAMWLRYPVAAALAYALFLVMVAGVVEVYKERARLSVSDMADLVPEPPNGAALDTSSDVSLDRIDFGVDGPDGDEGCLIVVIVALVLGLLMVAAYVVFTAPTLLAELVLDSLLVGGLYRRLIKPGPDDLYLAVFRRTWRPALLAILLLAVAGVVFEAYAPEAASVGAVFAKWSATW